jgi:hypothetical protein
MTTKGYAKSQKRTSVRRRGGKKGVRGQPKVPIDLETVERLGVIHCTQDELAAYFGVDRATISRRLKAEAALRKAFERGQVNGKVNLRRRQVEMANQGNIGMLIWLGKQLLGQQEAPATMINVNATATTNVDTRTPEEIRAHMVDMQRAIFEEAKQFGNN